MMDIESELYRADKNVVETYTANPSTGVLTLQDFTTNGIPPSTVSVDFVVYSTSDLFHVGFRSVTNSIQAYAIILGSLVTPGSASYTGKRIVTLRAVRLITT